MRTGSILLLAAAIPQLLSGVQSNFDAQANRWVISGNRSSVTLRLAEDGAFVAESLQDLESGDYWTASAQRPGPIRLQAGNEVYDATRMYTLVDQYVTQLSSGAGVRQFIVLQDVQKTVSRWCGIACGIATSRVRRCM
jgi:hypothetical protein